jgi:hypothetical protein
MPRGRKPKRIFELGMIALFRVSKDAAPARKKARQRQAALSRL